MIVNPKQLGRRIGAARARLGLSQTELARRLDLPGRTTMARIEAGRRSIRTEELAAAAALFGVAVDHLLDPLHLGGEAEIRLTPGDAGACPPESREAARLAGERLVAGYRYLMQRTGERGSLFRLALRLPRRLSEEAAERAGRELAKTLLEEWKKTVSPDVRKFSSPRLDALFRHRLGMRVFILPEGTPPWSGHCRLENFEAIVVSPAFLDTAASARPFYDQLFQLLTPGRWHRPELIRRFGDPLAEALGSNFEHSGHEGWAPPGENYASLLWYALRVDRISEDEAVRLMPGSDDIKAVLRVLARHGFPWNE